MGVVAVTGLALRLWPVAERFKHLADSNGNVGRQHRQLVRRDVLKRVRGEPAIRLPCVRMQCRRQQCLSSGTNNLDDALIPDGPAFRGNARTTVEPGLALGADLLDWRRW